MLPSIVPVLGKHQLLFSSSLPAVHVMSRKISVDRRAAGKAGGGSESGGGSGKSESSRLAQDLLQALKEEQSYPPPDAHALLRQAKKRAKPRKSSVQDAPSKSEPAKPGLLAAAPSKADPPGEPSPLSANLTINADPKAVAPQTSTAPTGEKSSASRANVNVAANVAGDLLKKLQKEQEYPPALAGNRRQGLALDMGIYQLFRQSRLAGKAKRVDIQAPHQDKALDVSEAAPVEGKAAATVKAVDVPFPSPLSKAPAQGGTDERPMTGLLKALSAKPAASETGPNTGDQPERTDIKALLKSMKSHAPGSGKGAQSKASQKRRVSLTDGPTLSLFGGVTFDAVARPVPEFVSLHEKQWLADVTSLLPAREPQNAFEEEMLTIDKQWTFPVDNEDAMLSEIGVSFEDHVFLDHLLEDFPREGPVRKFMELVVTGLQQNPHLTVEQKRDRILWHKDYFDKFSQADLVGLA